MRTQAMAHRCLALLIMAALGAPLAAGDSPDLSYLQGLGDVRYHHLESEILGRGLHIFVRVPESYDERETARFPTVYLLDGGTTFPLLAGYYRYLSLAGDVPDSILVGISYGSEDRAAGNLRSTDFTAPSAESEHYGGAPLFQELLRRELLPLIEGGYRSDSARRVIFGQSLGGQFVLFTALTDPGLFWGHIASNPALHRNLPFFLGAFGETKAGGRVFVGSADGDDERFRTPAVAWMEHWAARQRRPWELKTATIPGHNHFSAAPIVFREGMAWLFPPVTADPR